MSMKAKQHEPYTEAEEKAADAHTSVANYLMLYHKLRWVGVHWDLDKLRM